MAIKRLEVSNPIYSENNTQTLTIFSSHLDRRHDVSVYNIDAAGNDLPIIILMHGVYGNHWVWMKMGGVHKAYQAAKKALNIGEFILVMPSDGGMKEGSAYLPTRTNGNYEQWIMDDVITAVINSNKNVSNNSNIYLSGLSMGGYGALRLGLKFAKNVAGISAHSSIIDIEQLKLFTETDLSEYQCEDKTESCLRHWASTNKGILPPLRFDCGEEDELYQANIAFSQALTEVGIDHQFQSFTGGHSWNYWHKNVVETFTFFNEIEYINRS